VIPVHVAGPWATLFHLFDRFSPELRDITLFHELLNKTGGVSTSQSVSPIPPDALDADAAVASAAIKAYVEQHPASFEPRPSLRELISPYSRHGPTCSGHPSVVSVGGLD
jgi:hypothetical protein